mmetsp:Transcript_8444/g.8357  ORF Transcript_8444/g.8357 Transcript_8444/m.8357 type:complete len:88 (+) Transcript_8444:35-298(+)
MSQYKNNHHQEEEEDTQHQHDEIRGEIAVLDNTPESDNVVLRTTTSRTSYYGRSLSSILYNTCSIVTFIIMTTATTTIIINTSSNIR